MYHYSVSSYDLVAIALSRKIVDETKAGLERKKESKAGTVGGGDDESDNDDRCEGGSGSADDSDTDACSERIPYFSDTNYPLQVKRRQEWLTSYRVTLYADLALAAAAIKYFIIHYCLRISGS